MNNQMNYPKVSIVTPSYNCGKYIGDTLDSIHNQNYPNLEHIVMDGGSTDETLEILRKYPQVIWKSEKDRGQSHALNKAFELTTGQIIGWLNADDTYVGNSIHEAVIFFEANPHIDMVFTDLNIIDEKNSLIGKTKGGKFEPIDLLTKNPIKQPSLFMRKEVIEKLKGVNEKYHYVMDREFWLRVSMAGYKFEYLSGKIWANFRLCEGTKSFERTPLFREEWLTVINEAFTKPFFEGVLESKKKEIIDSNRYHYHTCLLIEAAGSGNRMEVVSQYLNSFKYNPLKALSLGMLKFLLLGITGLRIDRFSKFKKID